MRADFPIFEQVIHGKPLAFLDSAASSQKPRQMIEAMTDFYSTSYANVHRGVYVLAERATAALEGAREKVRALLNAPDVREIIFVRNATEAINLVAYSWGMNNLGPGDLVVVTELEHHSNFVPWQYIAGNTGAQLAMIPLDEQGELDLSTLDAIAAQGNVKVVADEPGLELARDDQPRREARRVGARAGRDLRLRRRAVRAAHDGRRAGARRRLRRDLGTRCAARAASARSGGARAARGDGAVPHRRPHDQLGALRQDDVGRAAAQVRGGHGADGGGRRLRRRDRLPPGRRLRRDRGARARARRVRARSPERDRRHHAVRPARRPACRDRLVQRRRRPSARRRADPRHAGRCDPRRAIIAASR